MREDSPGSPTATPTRAPQMRALLFTDLCDSLTLVERIGDLVAAELFQQHDRLVLNLQQQWHGRQIDRSDGLFLLFDRIVDALGFALEYQHQLQRLGEQRGIVLRARAGLHVGEVILWNNPAEAVALGSKAVEVEGLAKPLAARLMQLARPGQILVSSPAESMVRRFVGDLGPIGEGLKWKSFGRWRFKGVPQPMEIFTVGIPAQPAQRRPASSAKAWPDVALWRRPMALAAQAAVVVLGGVLVWLMARPQPAIAFAERDWVVLADVQNMTGNQLLGEGLTQAFRVSLEQSRHVNVLSELKTRDSLERMLLPEGALLDRGAAVQVAAREGARAVLVPVVREVQGKLRVSVDVLEPSSSHVVYSVHADGNGYASALPSTDKVVAELRTQLGEAISEIRKASAPLPEVATADLDALNAYAKGVATYGKGEAQESIKYFDIATRIDPGFAMAYLGKMRALASLGHRDNARAVLQQVKQHRDRLTTREALYTDAWALDMFSDSEAVALDAWKTLATLYPDHHGANVNHALAAFAVGRLKEAGAAAQRTNVAQNGMRALSLQLVGRIQLAAGEVDDAVATLREASALSDGRPVRILVAALAAGGRRAEALNELQAIPRQSVAHWLEAVSLDLEQGQYQAAVTRADASADSCTTATLVCDWLSTVAAVTEAAAGKCVPAERLQARFEPLMKKLADPDVEDRGQRLYFAAAMVYAAQRMGADGWSARQVPALARLATQVEDTKAGELVQVVLANNELAAGNAAAALARLQPLANGQELYQLRSTLAASYAATGDERAFADVLHWLQGHRGLAYAEYSGSSVLQPINVRDSMADAFPRACRAASASPALR